MKRKTFVKQLMAMGFQRNAVNKACKYARWLERRINEKIQGCGLSCSWEEMLEDVVRTVGAWKAPLEDADEKMYMEKVDQWKTKRNKKMPKERMEAETRWTQ